MNVWKMNLIDNRDIISIRPENEKFEFCKGNNIIGIGWVGYDDNDKLREDSSYHKAKNAFLSINVGDLVWTKNPSTGNYYICKVKSLPEYKGNKYESFDIGYCCKCEYHFVGTAEQLSDGISEKDLICLSAICGASDALSKNSKKLYDDIVKKKKVKIIGLGIIVLVALSILISITAKNNNSSKNSESNIEKEIVSENTEAKAPNKKENFHFPGFKEFVERIKAYDINIRQDFYLHSDTNGGKAYARYDDPKMGYLSYSASMMMFDDPYDGKLKIVYNTVKGKPHLVITRESPINDDALNYLDLFLMDYPERLYIDEMIEQFKESETIINGEKVYKTTVGDVSYAFYEKQPVGTCRIIIDVK